MEALPGDGVDAAPDGEGTVQAAEPGIDRITHPEAPVRCGDTVGVQVFLKASGFDGALRLRFKAKSDDTLITEVTEPVNGRLMVPYRWTAKKGDNVWTDETDVVVNAMLLDSTGAEAGTAFDHDGIHIVRYDNATRYRSISGGRRRGERWTQDAAGTWVHQPASPYGWDANYRTVYEDGIFHIRGRLKLVPQGGLAITNAMKTSWKSEIERYWNNRYQAHRRRCGRGRTCDCDQAWCCCKFEVKIHCDFVNSHELTSVNVHAGAATGPWGSANWWYSSTWWELKSANVPAAVRAHEFGHNIGLWDEYDAGAVKAGVNPNTYAFNNASIMSSGARPQRNHFDGWLWTAGRITGDRFRTLRRQR